MPFPGPEAQFPTRLVINHRAKPARARDSDQRRLVAILAADIAVHSRLMGEDDIATLLARKGDRAVVLPMVAAFGGHIIDTAGDGILAETASAVADVECTWWFQEPMAARSERVTEARRMRLRLGINLDEVYCGEQRTDGDGINIATRLENLTL